MSVHLVPAGFEVFVNKASALYSSLQDQNPNSKHKEKSKFSLGTKEWEFENGFCVQEVFKHLSYPFLLEEKYNSCTPALGPAGLKLNGFKYCLLNPNAGQGVTVPYNAYKDAGLECIVDSGGFQLFSGKTDFVDPEKLANEYNKLATIGMDLDVPDAVGITKNYSVALAKIQKANYERMHPLLNKNVKLCCVVHGKTAQERMQWAETLDRENPECVAVAGLQRDFKNDHLKLLQIAEAILVCAHLYPKANYFHILGTTSAHAWIIYSLIEQLGLVQNIGADSVTATLNMLTGQFRIFYPLSSIGLPIDFKVSTRIPCSCSVCSTIKDFRLYKSRTVIMHGFLVQNEHKNFIYRVVKELLAENISYKNFLDLTCCTTIKEVELRKLVEYIQECKTNGFKPLPRCSSSLFTKDPKMPVALAQKYDKIIKNYEDYHGRKFL